MHVAGLFDVLLEEAPLDGVVERGGFSSLLDTEVKRFLFVDGNLGKGTDGPLEDPGFTLTGAGTLVLFDFAPELRFSATRQAGIHSSYLVRGEPCIL